MAKKQAIELAEDGRNLLPISHEPAAMQAMIDQNLGGDELTMGDLERAVNPSGKNLKWTFDDELTGETDQVDTIEGVIIHSKKKRVLYLGEYKGGGEPPDCYSDDGINGVGKQADKVGGKCENCPLSKFGSGKNNSQACSAIKRLWVLREGEMLPVIVNLTPINNKALKKYGVNLMNKKGKNLSQVISRLKLEADKSKSGYDYAKVRISLVEILNVSDAEKMEAYGDMLRPMLDATTIRDEVRDKVYDEDDVVDVTPPPDPAPTGDVDELDDVEF